MWCIPPQEDAAFVCQMEQVLEVYELPSDPQFPVVNMDEQHKQLIRDTEQPIPAAPGCPARIDHEYVREGACVIWMFVEALAGWRNVTVTEHRTANDWAEQVRQLVDHPRYAAAERITLVCDNLNTHTMASLYQTFPPEEALRIARRIEIVHTPKHGSWLNMAEIELSVLKGQCLNSRIPDMATMKAHVVAWEKDRNNSVKKIKWQFTTSDARIKLKQLYPKV